MPQVPPEPQPTQGRCLHCRSLLCIPRGVGVRASGGVGVPPERDFTSPPLCFRAEPVLSRIQENRKRVILPSIDNIKQDTFEVQRYENSAHGYSWELWCMYISPPKDWWDAGDPSLPIRSVQPALEAVGPQMPGTREPEGGRVGGAPRGGQQWQKPLWDLTVSYCQGFLVLS